MTNIIPREVSTRYQVVELQTALTGQGLAEQVANRNGAIPKINGLDDAGFKQAEQQIETLNNTEVNHETKDLSHFFNKYASAAATVTSSLDAGEVLNIFAREIVALLEAGSCHVFKWDNAFDQAILLADFNSQDEETILLDEKAFMQTIRPLVRRTVIEPLPHQFALVRPGDSVNGVIIEELDARILLLLPLVVRRASPEQVAIVAIQKSRAFSHREILSARRFASQAAIAVENAQQYEASLAAINRLESVNEELEAFAHTVAHDLKSPLATVIGSAEFLKCADGSWPQEELKELTKIIAESSRRMLGIIDGLLLLATVDQKDIEIAVVDMEGALTETRSRLEETLKEKNAEVIVTSKLLASSGYRPWVEQVFTNLLSNAIKYGGQSPRIEIGASRLHDGTLRYWVKDSGSGLTKEQQAELFQPFMRFHDKSATGHGLGLSIARRIVERLGGEIGVESEVGQGSIFFFTLPGIADN